MLGLLALAGCTHGMELENGARPVRQIAQINFLFSEGQSEFPIAPPAAPAAAQAGAAPTPPVTLAPPAVQVQPSPAAPQRRVTPPDLLPAETQAPSPTSPAAPTAAPTAASTAAATPTPTAAATPTPTTVPATPEEIAAIAADDTAASLAIPAAEIDPGLEVFDEDTDPANYLAPELIAESNLVSFIVTGGRRQSAAGASTGRPVQLVQRVFVHADAAGASVMYPRLRDEAAPAFAVAALDFFREIYPDLTQSSRAANQFSAADENHLIEVRIDPQVEPSERALGPGDPHVYYLIMRQGRVTAIFEVFYLSQQNPPTVALLVERLVNRLPQELSGAAAPS